MLSKYTKYVVVNNSGQTITYNNNGRISLSIVGYYINPATGKLVDAVLSSEDFGFGAGDSIADGAEAVGTLEIDNSSNGYLGHRVQLTVTHDAGALADGTFDVYLSNGQTSGALPTDQTGYASAESNGLHPVGRLTWPSSTDDFVMTSNEWNV